MGRAWPELCELEDMHRDGPSRRVRHPILHLDVVTPDGTRTTGHRVFCHLRRQSVDVGICTECVHCDAIEPLPAPSVDCTIPSAPGELRPDPDGERTEVGKVLVGGAVALEESCSLREALRIVTAGRRQTLAVVTATEHLVGMVHEVALARAREELDPRGASVTVAMSSAIAVHEAVPVRVALRLLAATHSREATVVTTDGKPLGVFRDIDGMTWIARARDESGLRFDATDDGEEDDT